MTDSPVLSRPRVEPDGEEGDLGLLSWLAELDRLLATAVRDVADAMTPAAVLDPFRGVHITEDDVNRLLARSPGGPVLKRLAGEPPRPARTWSRLERLERTFELTPFDSAVLLVAVAPELDLRYERLYGWLQDDITSRRATLDLVLTLLCPGTTRRLAGRRRLAENAPLRRHGLVRLTAPPGRAALACVVEPDAQVVRLMLRDPGPDPRLAAWATLRHAHPAGDEAHDLAGMLAAGIRIARRGGSTGDPVGAAAARLGRPVLEADPARRNPCGVQLRQALDLLVREAWLHEAVLHVHDDQGGTGELPDLLQAALRSFPAPPPCVLTTGRVAPAGWVADLPQKPAKAADRARIWTACLDRAGAGRRVDVSAVAAAHRLDADQIEAAVRTARGRAARREILGSGTPRVTAEDLAVAARVAGRVELGPLGIRVDVTRDWDDLVLPGDVKARLRELCDRIRHRDEVLLEGGFATVAGAGGAAALFAGPCGSGKTLAASVIAGELGLDLLRVDLSAVVSKYIGETEKNLEQVFGAAQRGDLLLLFDECDALFGKRSEVRDARDRYANVETAYLLQRIEAFPGTVILTTNLPRNLDEAFTRRLALTVHFPLPGAEERQDIWRRIWPAATAVAADVDARELAHRFTLSGGDIRNAALAAAFLAAADGSAVVTRDHVLHAVRREYQKLGTEPPAVSRA